MVVGTLFLGTDSFGGISSVMELKQFLELRFLSFYKYLDDMSGEILELNELLYL
jgi:hypothetical protein